MEKYALNGPLTPIVAFRWSKTSSKDTMHNISYADILISVDKTKTKPSNKKNGILLILIFFPLHDTLSMQFFLKKSLVYIRTNDSNRSH